MIEYNSGKEWIFEKANAKETKNSDIFHLTWNLQYSNMIKGQRYHQGWPTYRLGAMAHRATHFQGERL